MTHVPGPPRSERPPLRTRVLCILALILFFCLPWFYGTLMILARLT